MAYTNIDDPSAYFQVKTWTGNASTNAITLDGNTDMQPDFMWHKEQNDTNGWHQFDSSRGVTKYLASNSTGAEGTFANYLSSFDSNGFTAGSGDSSMNSSSTAQCSWLWKANGGTTATNSDGSTDTTVQANTAAGFSIVTFTTDGGNETYGHGLGVKPDIVIVKSRSGGGSWIYMTDVIDGSVDYLLLNDTNAAADLSYGAFTSSTFQYNDNNAVTQIAYCFASKQGYSKFGKYFGNSHSGGDGPFIHTGFAPAYVMIKRTDGANDWIIHTYKLGTLNAAGSLKGNVGNTNTSAFRANETSVVNQWGHIDMLSNGFKVRSAGGASENATGTYLYMAFAEHPFVTSTGIPTTAR